VTVGRLAVPRLAIAGLSGDSGKTLVSLGLGRSLVGCGMSVRAYKKGPDYIDAAWLTAATGVPCRNLDTFFMSEAALGTSAAAAAAADFLLLEGNRGLFDGADAEGTHSTAALARRLGAPLVLVLDVTKMTRTAAAIVLGCRHLDPELDLAGVILNRVGTGRQETLIRRAIEEVTGVPVVGAIPRLKGDDPLPGRHLGLVTAAEHPSREDAIALATDVVENHVDLSKVVNIAGRAAAVELPEEHPTFVERELKIAYFADETFSFYYPENLEQLREGGAKLIGISPRSGRAMPEVDALYIGGGFPEVHAARLAESGEFATSLCRQIEQGLPVYAECGGLMYLARELVVDGITYPMAGALDLVVEQTRRPQGHGYEVAVVDQDNPFFATGTELKGHEFHYSHIIDGADASRTVLSVERGYGTGNGRDGIVRGNVWASYLHLHALSTSDWALNILELAAGHAAARAAAATEA
jgi:cobyrinic acid a,c-diamide synthase